MDKNGTAPTPAENDDIILTPSPGGRDCIGNGEHESIEIQCDECNYFFECFPDLERSFYNGNEFKPNERTIIEA